MISGVFYLSKRRPKSGPKFIFYNKRQTARVRLISLYIR